MMRSIGGAETQIDACCAAEGQRAVARGEVDDGPVRAVDDLPIAVATDAGAMRIEGTVDGQVVPCRKPDRADLEAAGIDAAVDGETASVGRDLDSAGAHLVANDDVALLDLETPCTEHAARRQPGIEPGEIIHQLCADGEVRSGGGNESAASVIPSAAASEDRAAERHLPCARAERDRLDAAAIVQHRRDIDHRPRRLRDVATRAGHDQLAARAVTIDLEEGKLATGQIDARAIIQHDVAGRVQRQLAGGERNRAVDADILCGQAELRAEARR